MFRIKTAAPLLAGALILSGVTGCGEEEGVGENGVVEEGVGEEGVGEEEELGEDE